MASKELHIVCKKKHSDTTWRRVSSIITRFNWWDTGCGGGLLTHEVGLTHHTNLWLKLIFQSKEMGSD